MTKTILDIGNCGPDHGAVTRFFTTHFPGSEVAQADKLDDALPKMKATSFDLVVVNRKLDCDYTDGLDVIKALKADPATADVPMMLITNLPEHQELAEAAGAVRGFGKLEYDKLETLERVKAVLG